MLRKRFGHNFRKANNLPTIVVNKYLYQGDGISIMRGTDWGNRYKIGEDGNREEVVRKFANDLRHDPRLISQVLRELRHQVLICCCKPLDCHGDVLADLANWDWNTDGDFWINSKWFL